MMVRRVKLDLLAPLVKMERTAKLAPRENQAQQDQKVMKELKDLKGQQESLQNQQFSQKSLQ